MAELVGKRYAEALFEVAVELNKLDQFKEEIKAISDVLETEVELKTIFRHPKLSKNEKKDIINSIFKDRVSQEIINLIYIVIDKGREKFIKDISDEYIVLSNKKLGIVEAEAVTAVAMSQEEIDKLQSNLSEKMGKKVILTNMIDKKIIGGVLVRIADRVMDASIKGHLDAIQQSLSNIRVSIE